MRIIAVLLLIVSLCACAPLPSAQIRCEPSTDFSCTASCVQAEAQYTFDLTVSPDGSFSLYMQEPAFMHGVGFLYADGNYTVDANGLQDTFTQNTFTEKSPVRLLFSALREFLFTGTEALTAQPDGTFTAQRTIDGLPVSAVLTSDGILKSLYCSATDTVFSFSYKDEEP